MRCAEAERQLAAYVNGHMSEREAMDLLEHTAECAACRTRLEALEVSKSRIASALHAPVESPDVADSVMARLPVRQTPAARRWVWAYALAAACVVVILMICVMPGRRDQPHKAGDVQVVHPRPMNQPRETVRPQNVVEEPQVRTDQVHRQQSVVKRNNYKAPRSPHKPQAPRQMEPAGSAGVAGPRVEPEVQPQVSQASFQAYGQTVYVLPPNKEAEPIERPALGIVRNSGPEREFIKPEGG